MRADRVEEYLASRGIQVWSADLLADDWHHISSSRVYDLAIKRLEEKGKGILLLHDIQARTAAALPRILHEMKVRGYHIVHVVPATLQQPATPTEPPQWQFHPPSENVPIAHWPKIPHFVFAEAETFAAPVLPNFDTPDGALLLSAEPFNRARLDPARLDPARLAQNVPLPREAPWPRQNELPVQNAAITLPVPEESLFEVPSDARAAFEASPPRRAEMTAEGETEGRSRRASTETGRSERATGKHGRGAKTRLARGARQTTRVAHAGRAASKHQAPAGRPARRPVHVASLKKR
jgi:hypothetical protein